MAQDVFSSMGETATRKASEVADAAGRKVQEVADMSREKWDSVKKRSLEEVVTDTRDWIRANPGKTLIGALAAGYLLGRLLRRR